MMLKDLKTSSEICEMEPQWDEIRLSILTSYNTSRDKINNWILHESVVLKLNTYSFIMQAIHKVT